MQNEKVAEQFAQSFLSENQNANRETNISEKRRPENFLTLKLNKNNETWRNSVMLDPKSGQLYHNDRSQQ